jgi:hypothetical protein
MSIAPSQRRLAGSPDGGDNPAAVGEISKRPAPSWQCPTCLRCCSKPSDLRQCSEHRDTEVPTGRPEGITAPELGLITRLTDNHESRAETPLYCIDNQDN